MTSIFRTITKPSSAFNLYNRMMYMCVGALVGLIALSMSANAQSERKLGDQVGVEPTYVMVIDQDYVVNNSAALDEMRPRVDRLTSAWEKSLNEARLRLKDQNDLALQTYQEGSEELATQQKFIQSELELLGAEVERRTRRLNEINVRAIQLVRRQVTLVAQKLAQARGANMIINKGQGIWVPRSLDLTEEVLIRINQDYKRIEPLADEIDAEILDAEQ